MKKLIFALFILTSCSSNQKDVDKKKAELYFSQGTNRLMDKDYTEALKHLLEANNLEPENPLILNNLGMAYYFKGKPDIAKTFIKQSLELDPKNSDARNNLASIYFTEKNYDEAIKEYEVILADLLYNHTYRAYYNLALIYLAKNDIKKAQFNLEQSIGLRADYCPAGFQLALLYKKNNQAEKSLDTFKIATRENCAVNPEPFYEWGNLLLSLGKDSEALEKFQYLIDKFPSSPFTQNALDKTTFLKKRSKFSVNEVDHIDSFKSGSF